MTPLMLAIKGSHANVIQLLLDQKPDLNIRDYTGRGPLDWSRTQRDRRIETMVRVSAIVLPQPADFQTFVELISVFKMSNSSVKSPSVSSSITPNCAASKIKYSKRAM